MTKKMLMLACCSFVGVCLAGAQSPVRDTLETDRGISASPAEMLRGKVSGVRVSLTDGNPEGLVNVDIRGVNSLRGSTQPLWVIDGAVLSSYAGENIRPFWQDEYADYSYA